MKVVVLAGGIGSRLQPVIKDLPKPMADINGRPFLECLLEQIRDSGQNDFIICLCHQAHKVIQHFGNGSHWGINIDYSIEDKPLGTGGALGLLRTRFKSAFWLINADTYLECNLQAMLEQHIKHKARLTMALAEVSEASRFGRVEMDAGGRILDFREKQTDEVGKILVNAGLYLLEPNVLDLIPPDKPTSLEKDIMPRLISENSPVYGFAGVANFFDIGIPEDYFSFKDWMDAKSKTGQVEEDIKSDEARIIERKVGEAIMTISSLRALEPVLDKIAHAMVQALKEGRRVYLCGNGGSAADAQHLAAELTGRLALDREPLPAAALTTNTSVLTAIANDYGYDEVFARQVRAFIKPGDILIGISTSGSSANVFRAMETAKTMGAVTIAFTGRGGCLSEIADFSLAIPSNNTPHIQEALLTAGHIICGLIEEKIFGGKT